MLLRGLAAVMLVLMELPVVTRVCCGLILRTALRMMA